MDRLKRAAFKSAIRCIDMPYRKINRVVVTYSDAFEGERVVLFDENKVVGIIDVPICHTEITSVTARNIIDMIMSSPLNNKKQLPKPGEVWEDGDEQFEIAELKSLNQAETQVLIKPLGDYWGPTSLPLSYVVREYRKVEQ